MTKYAISDNGNRVPLDPDGDNWERLQDLLDNSSHVTLPVGIWNISRTLNIGNSPRTLRGYGPERTKLVLNEQFPGPVIGISGDGRWQGSESYEIADNVSIFGIHFHQMSQENTLTQCIFCNDGDYFTVERCKVSGTRYEGIIAPGNNVNIRSFVAQNCGNGWYDYPDPDDIPVDNYYYLSTAGINSTAIDLLVDGFVCIGCGQGVETGNTRVEIRNGTIIEPGIGEPHYGVNVGSSSSGIFLTKVSNVIIRGYDSAIQVGPNGLGRLSGVTVEYCDVDGMINFSGGKHDNNVSHPDEGPDTYGSFIRGNKVTVTTSFTSSPIGVSDGLNTDGLYGREPLQITDNEIVYENDSPGDIPVIGFAGKITADMLLENNIIRGISSAPSRGDIASFSLSENPVVPGFPTLEIGNNLAYNASGFTRALSIKIEGA